MDKLPQNIWQLIALWVEQQKTGQIVLNLHEGKVLNAETKEKVLALVK